MCVWSVHGIWNVCVYEMYVYMKCVCIWNVCVYDMYVEYVTFHVSVIYHMNCICNMEYEMYMEYGIWNLTFSKVSFLWKGLWISGSADFWEFFITYYLNIYIFIFYIMYTFHTTYPIYIAYYAFRTHSTFHIPYTFHIP